MVSLDIISTSGILAHKVKLRGHWSTLYGALVNHRLGKQTQWLDNRGGELGLTEDLAFMVACLPEWEATYRQVWDKLLSYLRHKPTPVLRCPEALAALKKLTLAWHIESFWEGLNEYEEDPDEIRGPLPKGFIVTIPPPPDRRGRAAEYALKSVRALIYIVLVAISDVLGRVGGLIAHLLGQALLLLLSISAFDVHRRGSRWGLSPPPHPPPLLLIPFPIAPAAP